MPSVGLNLQSWPLDTPPPSMLALVCALTLALNSPLYFWNLRVFLSFKLSYVLKQIGGLGGKVCSSTISMCLEWVGSLKASPPVSFQIVASTRVTKGFQFYKLELNQGHSYIDIFPRIQLYFVNGSAKHRIIIVLRVLYDLGHAPEFSFELWTLFFFSATIKSKVA